MFVVPRRVCIKCGDGVNCRFKEGGLEDWGINT